MALFQLALADFNHIAYMAITREPKHVRNNFRYYLMVLREKTLAFHIKSTGWSAAGYDGVRDRLRGLIKLVS